MRHVLRDGAVVDLEADWLDSTTANSLETELRSGLPWEHRSIVLFGKPILQPRLIAWAGELPYRYSGQTLPPRPFTPSLARVLARVCSDTGVAFNHVLVNRYRNGMDSMGLHSDDERELGTEPVVATVSLGATRTFQLVPEKGREGKQSLQLTAGSLVVMNAACQHHYRHGIPKEPRITAERISLTFRHVLRAPTSK